MKSKFLIFSVIITLFATTFISCKDKDNDDSGVTTTEQDKEEISASFTRMTNLVQDFKTGECYSFGKDFLDIHQKEFTETYPIYDWVYNPETGMTEQVYRGEGSYGYYDDVISDFVSLMADKLGSQFDLSSIETNKRFSYSSFAGLYTWNKSTENWTKTANSSILLKFPSTKTGATNNCEMGITEYTDQVCNIEGKTVYLPTKAKAYFTKDGTKLASIDATATYNGYGIPKQANVSIYANPIQTNISLTQASLKKYDASVNIIDNKNTANNLSISGTVVLANDVNNYTDFTDAKINNISVNLTQGALKVNGTVDVASLEKISKPTAADINKYINIEVLNNDQKVGTLKVVDKNNAQYVYIVYKDGTEEDTSVYYDQFIKDIKAIFNN